MFSSCFPSLSESLVPPAFQDIQQAPIIAFPPSSLFLVPVMVDTEHEGEIASSWRLEGGSLPMRRMNRMKK